MNEFVSFGCTETQTTPTDGQEPAHGFILPRHCHFGRLWVPSGSPYSTLIFGSGTDRTGSNNPKEKIAVDDAIATYCFPSTAYVIGEAVNPSPIWKCHRCRPS